MKFLYLVSALETFACPVQYPEKSREIIIPSLALETIASGIGTKDISGTKNMAPVEILIFLTSLGLYGKDSSSSKITFTESVQSVGY